MNKVDKKYIFQYFQNISTLISRIHTEDILNVVLQLVKLKRRKGRLFILGVGGSAANSSHAVNDFRKICHIEAYSPTDNVSELTARVNDESWESVFSKWLEISNLSQKDMVMVFSVGGGSMKNRVSVNIIHALKYARKQKSLIVGIASRDGGYTKKIADYFIFIPPYSKETITPFAESIQAVIWHAIVTHPILCK